jgi:hypothetical protein
MQENNMIREINMFREGVSHAGEQEDLLHLFFSLPLPKIPTNPKKLL